MFVLLDVPLLSTIYMRESRLGRGIDNAGIGRGMNEQITGERFRTYKVGWK